MKWYKEIATNTLFQVIARIASSGSSFLITIIVARSLGIIGYGDFAKTVAFISLFYLFVDLGLNAIFLQKEDSKIRFKELFYSRFILSVIIVFAANCISYFLPYNEISQIGFSPQVRLGITIFSFTIITEGILYSSAAIFQRELSYEFYMIASIIGSVSTVIFVLLASMFTSSLFFVLGSYILGGVIESGFAIFFTKENLIPSKVDVSFVKKLAIDTLPISLMLIFNLIYFRIDIILLSLFQGSKDVAIYDLAYKFFDFLIALPLFLSNALYPSLIEKAKREKNLLSGIKKYIVIFAIISMVILIPAWFLSPLISLIKKEFTLAALPLRILLISLPIFFITSILQWILIARKQQKFLAVIYFLLAIVNIGLNIVFIPKFSYIAASVITGICEFFVLVILWIKIFIFKNKAYEEN